MKVVLDVGLTGVQSINIRTKTSHSNTVLTSFILACITGFLLQLEPYQGKNAANVSQTQMAQIFLTPHKAVLNATEKSRLKKCPDAGHRVITMDYQYTSPFLFVTLLFLLELAPLELVGPRERVGMWISSPQRRIWSEEPQRNSTIR